MEVGKTYKVNHSRKGKFTMKVTYVDEEWATGVITDGHAKGRMHYNYVMTGESVTVRRSLAEFEEVQ